MFQWHFGVSPNFPTEPFLELQRPSLFEASMYQMRVGASEVANVRQLAEAR